MAKPKSSVGCEIKCPTRRPTAVAATVNKQGGTVDSEEVAVDQWWACNPQQNTHAINIRREPRFTREVGAGSISPGEVFKVVALKPGDKGITWLKLDLGRGWLPASKPGYPDVCVRAEDPAKLRAGGKIAPLPEEKQITLARSLLREENRNVARKFFYFFAALASLPIIGVFACEYLLRGVVPDKTTRLSYSAVFAVILVNMIMACYAIVAACEEPREVEQGKKER